jgi:hypothetical protein
MIPLSRVAAEESPQSMLVSEGLLICSLKDVLSVLCVTTGGTEILDVGVEAPHLLPHPGQNCHLLDRLALQLVHIRPLPLLLLVGLFDPLSLRDDDRP